MKQAILITAYKDFQHLASLVNFFDTDVVFYVHIDRKSTITTSELASIATDRRVLYISRKYRVNWASLNHLKSILTLAEEAIKNQELEYVHLISGQDFPSRSPESMKRFLERNRGKEFIRTFELPSPHWHDDNGGLDRITYYHFYDLFNQRSRLGAKVNRGIFLVQKKIVGTRRDISRLPKLYGGGTWWTLSRGCLKYIVEYKETHPSVWRRFRYTRCPEEIYFPTIIMNSPFKANVVNDALRYIVWECRYGSYPAILDETDYKGIVESGKFFARKLAYPMSEKLVSQLRKLKS